MKRPFTLLSPVVAALIAGCAQLPLDGPTHRDIAGGALVQLVADRHAIGYDYALIDVTSNVIDNLGHASGVKFQSLVSNVRSGPRAAQIGIGDVVQVTVFESSPGGLFLPAESGPRPANSVTIPNQTVAGNGMISVPYAGKIRAAGRNVEDIEHDIQSKISGRAIEPQVVISLIEQNAATVSVIGDTLNGASRFKLSATGERVLDMIARAGGTRYPGFELFVTLVRKDRRATISFSQLVNDPAENIFVAPGDTLYVARQQQKYVAIGALGTSSQTSGVTGLFPFDQERISLNEALAKSGGLLDTRADPGMVFLYRMEQRSALEKFGIDVSSFPEEQGAIPTVYRLNFRDPSSFFMAQRFMMRDHDVIYAANADTVEMQKFFDHARAITSTIAGVSSDISLINNLWSGGTVVSSN